MKFKHQLLNLLPSILTLCLLLVSLTIIIRGQLTSEWQQHAITTHAIVNWNNLVYEYTAIYENQEISLVDYENRFAKTQNDTYLPRHFWGYSVFLAITQKLFNVGSFEILVKTLSGLLASVVYIIIILCSNANKKLRAISLTGVSVICFSGYGAWGTLDFAAFCLALIGINATFVIDKKYLGITFCGLASFIHPIYFSIFLFVILFGFIKRKLSIYDFLFMVALFVGACIPMFSFYSSVVDGFSAGQQYLNFEISLSERVFNYLFSPSNGLFVYYFPLFLTICIAITFRFIEYFRSNGTKLNSKGNTIFMSVLFFCLALAIILFIASQPIPNPTYTYITRYGMPLTALIIAFLLLIEINLKLVFMNIIFGIYLAQLLILNPDFNRQKLGHQAPVETALNHIFSSYFGTSSSFQSYLAPASYRGYSDFFDGDNLYVFSRGSDKVEGRPDLFKTDKVVNTISGVKNTAVWPLGVSCDMATTKLSHINGWHYIEPITLHINDSETGFLDVEICVAIDENNCQKVENAIVDVSPEYLINYKKEVEISMLVRAGNIKKAMRKGSVLRLVSGQKSCDLAVSDDFLN